MIKGPPSTRFTTLSEEEEKIWHVKPDTWHLTPDMWHLTCDMWHVTYVRRWIFSQSFSSLSLTVWDLWCLEDWEKKDDRLTDLINQLLNYKDVHRTALATPGLLKISVKIVQDQFLWTLKILVMLILKMLDKLCLVFFLEVIEKFENIKKIVKRKKKPSTWCSRICDHSKILLHFWRKKTRIFKC